jgi:hypothetical protein
VLFGAGLALSGMADPSRVRAFLDVAGAWDPTLAFVMGGALIPMSIAWYIKRRLQHPIAAAAFDVPDNVRLDAPLLVGAAIFGIGWGIAGLCPGPAIAGSIRCRDAGWDVVASRHESESRYRRYRFLCASPPKLLTSDDQHPRCRRPVLDPRCEGD